MSILPSSYCYCHCSSQVQPKVLLADIFKLNGSSSVKHTRRRSSSVKLTGRPALRCMSISASLQELDLTEDNVKQVLLDAREKFSHIFDTSVGMTGVAELAEVDGPYVKISLKGRFWHERSLILARLGNYLKQRIPEILEVDIEDEKQLDDSPENF
ncbi:hypothetical protein DCAR_0520130 [Daucus carota subsp. sativus]|uniref:NIF system FeS cluster assembly NifU C-terminal domain-containing protein n=1 Tax=Daucus carota subsp. sativus TaxID=79200 RepID=A0AAF1AZR2_DAUCS|nr:PREDICTED: uncharacterized protein LOC108220145 [Daucus carota subsp. sativus]WOH00755.1 hypothetical protein DCAR_0520130 [Daucus carota subsp. sativus]